MCVYIYIYVCVCVFVCVSSLCVLCVLRLCVCASVCLCVLGPGLLRSPGPWSAALSFFGFLFRLYKDMYVYTRMSVFLLQCLGSRFEVLAQVLANLSKRPSLFFLQNGIISSSMFTMW